MNVSEIQAKLSAYEADKEYNRTPLMWAVRWNEIEVVKYLLNRLSEQQLREELQKQDDSYWRWTALHLACVPPAKPEIIELLLDAGAKTDVKDNDDVTPLIKAVASANPAIVQLFLRHGVDVDGANGRAALEEAESLGLIAIADMLRRAGAGQ